MSKKSNLGPFYRKISKDGRLIIPKPIVDALKIKAGDEFNLEEKPGMLILTPKKNKKSSIVVKKDKICR